MIKSTERAAKLQMKLKTPTMHLGVNTIVSPQQWGLINSIIRRHHPSHLHKANGDKYTLLHTAFSKKDQSEQAVYISEDGKIWVCPMCEFKEKFSEVKEQKK